VTPNVGPSALAGKNDNGERMLKTLARHLQKGASRSADLMADLASLVAKGAF
jgi:hypothetical protein